MTLGSSSSTDRIGSTIWGRAMMNARSGSAMALRASVKRPGPGQVWPGTTWSLGGWRSAASAKRSQVGLPDGVTDHREPALVVVGQLRGSEPVLAPDGRVLRSFGHGPGVPPLRGRGGRIHGPRRHRSPAQLPPIGHTAPRHGRLARWHAQAKAAAAASGYDLGSDAAAGAPDEPGRPRVYRVVGQITCRSRWPGPRRRASTCPTAR